MHLSVRCSCNVQRTIDTSQVGPWRLRCKQCGDVIYDPSAEALEVATPVAPVIEEDPDSQFQDWLEGSAELKVLLSADGTDAPRCQKHPAKRIIAACTRCSQLLCKKCLDRVDDEFVCSDCAIRVAAAGGEPGEGGFFGWFKRLFGG
ncbi:hypothetical protein OAX78_03985 [Planctomycetota bacterium]|nr:hypothetical protein [Planctomycetota bacterium]